MHIKQKYVLKLTIFKKSGTTKTTEKRVKYFMKTQIY